MNLTDRVAVKLMFVQAPHIVTGYYYCPTSTVLNLAGILMYHKFGAHNPNKHCPGFIPPVGSTSSSRPRSSARRNQMCGSEKSTEHMQILGSVCRAHVRVSACVP